jgi:hypothetical protein
MKQVQRRFILFILFMLIATVACQGQLEPAATGDSDIGNVEETEAVGPEPTAVVAEGTLAYVQDKTLYIWPSGGEPLAVESCPADTYCFLQFLKWSPDGRHLLYYFYDDGNDSLHLANHEGQVQVVAEDIAFVMPGDWSPDGQSIVFLRSTDTFLDGTETTPPVQVNEVWTAVLDPAGMIQEPQLVGNTNRMPDGCGGGGRSRSEELYEAEGGTSYGYRMAVVEWSVSGTLLYTQNCGNVGINRFDMNQVIDLPPFEVALRNLILDESGTRWFAITGPTWSTEDGNHQLATGTPEETAVTLIPTTNPVELVFFGPINHKLYYTTRELLESGEISDMGEYFNFFKSGLWQINVDGSNETRLWQADDHAFAQVTQAANGDVVFVRVENDRPLYEALQNGSATTDNIDEFAPQRHIVRLVPSGELQPMVANAGQPQLTQN